MREGGTLQWEKTPGSDRDLGAGRGRQGGDNRSRKLQQNQAHGAGRRDKQRRLKGGGCGKIMGIRCTTLWEEVGSGCYKERVGATMTATEGGRWEGGGK